MSLQKKLVMNLEKENAIVRLENVIDLVMKGCQNEIKFMKKRDAEENVEAKMMMAMRDNVTNQILILDIENQKWNLADNHHEKVLMGETHFLHEYQRAWTERFF